MPTRGRFAPLNRWIPALNAHIEETAGAFACGLLNFHRVVCDARGELAEDLTYDGLHLNEAGYALLATHLAPLLE